MLKKRSSRTDFSGPPLLGLTLAVGPETRPLNIAAPKPDPFQHKMCVKAHMGNCFGNALVETAGENLKKHVLLQSFPTFGPAFTGAPQADRDAFQQL